jgi:hypothetical protein
MASDATPTLDATEANADVDEGGDDKEMRSYLGKAREKAADLLRLELPQDQHRSRLSRSH